MNCAPKLGLNKLRLRRKGLVPELLRRQALQSYLPAPRVPMDYVPLQVALEVLEAAPLPAAVELVLHVAEELLGGGVVDAVPLARHALGDARPLQPGGVGLVLVLPAHVRVHGRRRPVGQGLEEC